MKAGGHVEALKRPLTLESLLDEPEHRHLHFRPLNAKLSLLGKAEVFHVILHLLPLGLISLESVESKTNHVKRVYSRLLTGIRIPSRRSCFCFSQSSQS